MANNKKNNKRRPKKRAGRRGLRKYRSSASLSVTRSSSIIGYMRIVRTVMAALPISSGITGLFDVTFNLIKSIISNVSYFHGAYAMFSIRVGALMINSPLMAVNTTNLSFPGYPVSTRWLNIKIRNTTTNNERGGRWAAVFIPFREMHDSKHYTEVLTNGVTFEEVSSMPYSRVSDARKDILIKFVMRDKTMYCARPRELSESLGIVIVVWDTGSRDSFEKETTNSMFNCEFELEAGCLPHPIFGPSHRVNYIKSDIDIKSITDGKQTLTIHRDNNNTKSLEPRDSIDTEFVSLHM